MHEWTPAPRERATSSWTTDPGGPVGPAWAADSTTVEVPAGTEPGELGDLFGAVDAPDPAAPPSADLGDLFSDSAVVPPSTGDNASTEPAGATPGAGGLGDLFAGEVVAGEVVAADVAKSSTATEAGPWPGVSTPVPDALGPDSKAGDDLDALGLFGGDAPASAGVSPSADPSNDAQGPSSPAAPVETPAVPPTTDVWAAIPPPPRPVATSTPATSSAPDTPVSMDMLIARVGAPVRKTPSVPVVTPEETSAGAPATQTVDAPVAADTTQPPTAPVAVPMTIRTPAATELPPTQPAVPVEHGVGSGPGTTIEQNVPEAAANGSTRRGIADRHRAAQAASMRDADPTAVQDMSAAQQFRSVPETMWSNVSRILGLVSGDTAVQAVVNGFTLSRDRLVDAEQRRRFQETIAPRMINAAVHLNNPLEASATFDLAYDELIGISVLGPLWRDERITEILVDGWDKVVIERDGQLIQTPIKFRDHGHATKTARDLASKLSDRALTPANPLVTAQLPGARVNFAIGSIVRSGLSISLRKFRDMMGIDDLVKFGALNADMAEFLHQSVLARATVLVSGGTGTGKTTQINALSSWIPDNERVVTIEDAFELQLSNRNVVSLQTKERASADDEVLISQEMLLVNALRMRPDRIVVGEIREGRGAYVMLQAANTGHDGTMTTIHAQSPSVALNERLADLVMEVNPSSSDVVRRTVARAIDLVVQVTRRRGRRFISEIAVVDRSCFHDGMIQPEPVFVGDIDAEGNITFRHVGGVRPDTALGMKLAEVGFDVKVWEPAR